MVHVATVCLMRFLMLARIGGVMGDISVLDPVDLSLFIRNVYCVCLSHGRSLELGGLRGIQARRVSLGQRPSGV